jgi:hypothetical protein
MSFQIRAVAALALPALSAPLAVAQDAAPVPRPSGSNAMASPLAYRPAFEGYRRFADQPVLAWREANDVVGRIGGWQAYAREAQGGPQWPVQPKPATTPASQPGAHGSSGGHAGQKHP